MNAKCQRVFAIAEVLLLCLFARQTFAQLNSPRPAWSSSRAHRVLLQVDPRGRVRSHSPAAVELDFPSLLGHDYMVDESSVEVVALDKVSKPREFDATRGANERFLVPHRTDRLFGSSHVTLNFVLPDHTSTSYAVYFDSVSTAAVKRQEKVITNRKPRYSGLVGDGDFFQEDYQRREIAASHFDQFVDFDGDGDLDLFQGGVEPYVSCFENVGANRLAFRGRLANEGKRFQLPCSNERRSWLTVAFFDFDQDGDQDFFPSFNDGPDAGKIIYYRNSTDRKTGIATFTRVGPLQTVADEFLAGGAQAGGWFPSITFIRNWDGELDGRHCSLGLRSETLCLESPVINLQNSGLETQATARVDALVGSKNHCWLYRGQGTDAEGAPRFSAPVPIQAGGTDIQLVNPRFEMADVDGDGDVDLVSGSQPGPVWMFENVGTRTAPALAAGRAIAVNGKFLIGDAHSGATIADFDRDGINDLVAGRFWERTDLNHLDSPREFGGFYRQTGAGATLRFDRQSSGGPYTEQFQICDAVRQNCVRAVDWDRDGKLDLLAGDTDGFVWFFRNLSQHSWSLFARGEKLLAGGKPLSVTDSGGHARLDVCDWNGDGLTDLLVADGQGTLSLFPGINGGAQRALGAGSKLLVDGRPIQTGARASVLVCDWDNDGQQDIVLAGERSYGWHRNTGTATNPQLGTFKPITFAGRGVKYVRPNLGAFVDWNGDGKRDLIGCHFENSIRLYDNLGSGENGSEPTFDDAEGLMLLRASSPQMISGADAVDWNGDGDLDLLTGQGHGGSGLRFYERDWIEDELHDTHPHVVVVEIETKPD